MSHISQNLGLTVLENSDPADLTTVSDNFDVIDAVVGDIATVESSPTASSHEVGEFLLYEGRLYKVTSAISAGASLVLGTNVAAANIGSEIKSLQDSLSSLVKTKVADVGTVALNANGYYTLTVNTPGMFDGIWISRIISMEVYNWSAVSPVGSISIGFGGNVYVLGPANATITGLRIGYSYI